MFRKRILSWIIDYVFVIQLPFIVLSILFVLFEDLYRGTVYYKIILTIYLFVMIFYALSPVIKDVFGRSLGKKIMKLKIVTNDGKRPKFFQLIFRNLTASIWPVEVIMVLTGKKRLGDRMAKTYIVEE